MNSINTAGVTVPLPGYTCPTGSEEWVSNTMFRDLRQSRNGSIKEESPSLNPCVSGWSSPTPLAPKAAQRSISLSASSPQAGFTEQNGISLPL